ncbi:hypothetical protein KIN20_003631 [Parelaphostrongylus tenuis]|uniref:Uncharacterized protein n=1 Tax=Parelaphostrongylus tenuis TaxID=148309 RepID=A0AAD5LXL8_PARTN|nr:hypothetical protein KIN20_003631 [Parelaphostrongylus tenuis]
MENRYGGLIRKWIYDFVHNTKANLLITSVIIIIAMYISLVAIIGKPVFNPYSNSTTSTDSTMYDITSSTFSVFFYWIASVIAGYFFKQIRLPSLFGALCVGVFVKHVHSLSNLFVVDEYWHVIVRKLCLVIIIIRWGLGINGTYIRKNPAYPLALGVLSAIAEALAIATVSIVFFKIRFEFGVIGGTEILCFRQKCR